MTVVIAIGSYQIGILNIILRIILLKMQLFSSHFTNCIKVTI